jgi:hypothetical protein
MPVSIMICHSFALKTYKHSPDMYASSKVFFGCLVLLDLGFDLLQLLLGLIHEQPILVLVENRLKLLISSF